MRFSGIASVLVVNLTAQVAAHGRGGWDWVHGLPSCWAKCLGNRGCDSKSCICQTSQDSGYVVSAVECVVQSCNADGASVALRFLAPLQMYCEATRDGIPHDILSSAYACATATTTSTTASPTRKVEQSIQVLKPSKGSDGGLKSTITSTVTFTTTNGSGNTLQVLIPIVLGPSTMTTGEMMVSTINSKPTASPAATSNAEAADPTGVVPPQTRESLAPSATALATNVGNGSPFDLSVEGGSARWGFSAIFVGFGILLGAFARL